MIAEVAEHDGVGIGIVGLTTTDACFLLPMIDFSARTNLGVGILIK